MAKKLKIEDEVYGKMTLIDEEYWRLDNKIDINLNGTVHQVKVEINVCNIVYLKYEYGLMPEPVKKLYEAHPDKLGKEISIEVNNKQKELFKRLLMDNLAIVEKNMEEAALRKREEMMENQTEESFARILGKDKAKRVFAAKTREEKLESIQLKRMRVMQDCIEITCTCDWFSPSGGFSIFPDLGVEMLYVDCMSI